MTIVLTSISSIIAPIAAVAFILFLVGYRTISFYILVPLKLWREPVLKDPPHVPISLDELPEYAAQPVLEATQALAALGFRAAEHTRTSGAVPGGEAFRSIWISGDGAITALCIFTRIQRSRAPKCQRTVLFRTYFDDGTSLVAHDARIFGVLAQDPQIESVRWADVPDIRLLLELHGKRLHQLQGTRRVTPMSAGAAIQRLGKSSDETITRQVEAGFFWLDEAHHVYRRTLRGSYIMAWRLLWPWKQRRLSRADRELRAALAAVGMKTPEIYAWEHGRL